MGRRRIPWPVGAVFWVGEYRGDSGGFGALAFESGVDSAGLPSGVVRFDGLMAEIWGVRSEARARGTD